MTRIFCFAYLLNLWIITLPSTGLSQIKGDSLPLNKAKPLKDVYTAQQINPREFGIEIKKPRKVETEPQRITKGFFGGAITLFTGISTNASETSLWTMEGELSASDPAFSWRVPLYFKATFLKERERVKNDDGSTSIDVKKGLEVDWNQESYGFIFESQDTVGYFTLNTNLQSDALALDWIDRLIVEGKKATKPVKNFVVGTGYSFKMQIVFRKHLITMITNDNYFRTVILSDNDPVAVFQANSTYLTIGKSSRLNPYLLFNSELKGLTKVDLVRLALLNILVRNSVSKDFYPQ